MSAGKANIELVFEVRNKIRSGLSPVRKILEEAISSVRTKVKELQKDLPDVFSSLSKAIAGFAIRYTTLKSGIKNLVDSSRDRLKALSGSKSNGETESPAKAALMKGDVGMTKSTSIFSDLGVDPSEMLSQGMGKLRGSFVESVKMAMAWRDGMAKVNETTKLSDDTLSSLSSKILDIGSKNALPLEGAPENFEKLVKAGFNAKDALDAFDTALKAVKAGYSDMDTVAASTMATMQGTGIKDAGEVMDVYFATVKSGNIAFNDVAKNLPNVINAAKLAGQSFKDTAGSFSFLTSQGIGAGEATEMLNSTFQAISDPGIAKGFSDIGVSIADASGKTKPMLDVIGDLRNQFGGLTEEQRNTKLKAIGLEGDALGTVSSMIAQYDQLKDTIVSTNNSQGSMNDAVGAATTPMDNWILLTNIIKQDMIDLGSTILPLLDEFGIGIESVGNFLVDNAEYVRIFGAAILGAAAAWGLYELVMSSGTIATNIATAATGAYNLVMNANPIMLTVTAIGALIGGLVVAYKHSQSFRATLSGLLEAGKLLGDVFMGLGKILLGVFSLDAKMIFEGSKQLTSSIKEIADGGMKSRYHKGYQETIKQENLEEAKRNKEMASKAAKPKDKVSLYQPVLPIVKPVIKASTPTKSPVGNLTGKAEQVKNLTINMDAMVKMGDFVSTNPEVSRMGKRELEQWFTELCARMIRNMEMSYN